MAAVPYMIDDHKLAGNIQIKIANLIILLLMHPRSILKTQKLWTSTVEIDLKHGIKGQGSHEKNKILTNTEFHPNSESQISKGLCFYFSTVQSLLLVR